MYMIMLAKLLINLFGLDTLFSNNTYYEIKEQLIDKDEFGNLIANNKKRISTRCLYY
jgi:hypothetical protein